MEKTTTWKKKVGMYFFPHPSGYSLLSNNYEGQTNLIR